MDVILDGDRDFSLTGNPADVLASVAAVSDYLHERGRAILALKVDGRSVVADRLVDELKGKALSDVAELQIESESIEKLVSDCLSELEQALPDLSKACHELAAVFQGESPEEGYEPFQKLAEIWGHVKSREILVINALELDVSELAVNETPFTELHEGLNKHLSEAVDALKAGDCVLLGDLLEYELAPRAEAENSIVAMLQEKAGLRSA
jgi:hypothetical protein